MASFIDSKEDQGNGAIVFLKIDLLAWRGEAAEFTPGSCGWEDGDRRGVGRLDYREQGRAWRTGVPCLFDKLGIEWRGREWDGILSGIESKEEFLLVEWWMH